MRHVGIFKYDYCLDHATPVLDLMELLDTQFGLLVSNSTTIPPASEFRQLHVISFSPLAVSCYCRLKMILFSYTCLENKAILTPRIIMCKKQNVLTI